MYLEGIEIIIDYELYDIEFNWEKGLKALIDGQQYNTIASILGN